MVDHDTPLDFDLEDRRLSPNVTKKRKKVIGLDELLTDFIKERDKLIKRESKCATAQKCYDSDEDDDKTQRRKEALLSKFVDDCQKQVHDIKTEEEFPSWGQQIFGQQKSPPSLAVSEISSVTLWQSFTSNELNSVLELNHETAGETFLEGLLANGWLSKLVFTRGHVEDAVASWTFNLMLYSSNVDLEASARDFWLTILASKNQVTSTSITVDHIPSYSDLKDALEIYGYLSESPVSTSSPCKNADSGNEGPMPNITSWVRYLAACCQLRSILCIFSTLELEEFLGVVTCFFLDRKLQYLSPLFHECIQSIISCFTDSEWIASSEKAANSLACRIPKDLNCLRVLECIYGVNSRIRHFRSKLALRFLINCFNEKVADGEEVIRLLISIDVKDKRCDFLKVYIYLVLAETWLVSSPLLEKTQVICEMWALYLRTCSSQITCTDWRSYASKVRNRASYLLQNTMQRHDSE